MTSAQNTSADRPENVAASSRNGSRVANGTVPFLAADGRTAAARLLRDRERALAEPLGASLTVGERLRVQSAAFIAVRLEQARSALARGDAGVSDENAVRLAHALTRELSALDEIVARRRAADAQVNRLVAEFLAGKTRADGRANSRASSAHQV